jgi:hypothetical protein
VILKATCLFHLPTHKFWPTVKCSLKNTAAGWLEFATSKAIQVNRANRSSSKRKTMTNDLQEDRLLCLFQEESRPSDLNNEQEVNLLELLSRQSESKWTQSPQASPRGSADTAVKVFPPAPPLSREEETS